MSFGRLWAANSAKSGSSGLSSGTRNASWPECSVDEGAPPYRTGTWYFTDEWEAYRGVLPVRTHRVHPKDSGQTSIMEALNYSLRQKCAVLVRTSCSFSRCLAMHHVRIQLVIDEHNRRLAAA